MEGWQIGLIVVIVVGLGLIAFGAVRDRRLNARRRAEMLAPPKRDIPRFSPDAPTPHYLSELQARRPPADARSTALSDEERRELKDWLASSGPITISAGYATTDLVTDAATGWSVLREPAVLLCDVELGSVRELLGVMERQIPTGRPLVIAAPGISDELVSTFAVNHLQQIVTILPVRVTDDADRRAIAAATGATPISRPDLRSGYVGPDTLGRCHTWLSTPKGSHLA